MSADDAFLNAICERPTDDVPRLVYADYLEEHDQPERARFIRIQCELAGLTEQHPDWKYLVRQELELRRRFEKHWSIPGLRGVQHFNRGFVEVIQTSAEWLLDCSPDVFRQVPVRELRLVTMDRYLEEIVQLDFLDRIEILTLNNNSLGHSGRLELLLHSRSFDQLRRLELRNCMLWADSVSVLAKSPQASRLQSLDLSGNPIGNMGLEHLAAGPFELLHNLIIRGDELDSRECLHPEAATVLAHPTSRMKQLRHLDWSDQYIGDVGLLAFAHSENFFELERLELGFNEIGQTAVRAIDRFVCSMGFPYLRHLNLSGNKVNLSAAQQVTQWLERNPHATIHLQSCDLDPEVELHFLSTASRSRVLIDLEAQCSV